MGFFDFFTKKPANKPEIELYNEGKKNFDEGVSSGKRAIWMKSLELKSENGIPFFDTSKLEILMTLAAFTEAVDSFDKAVAIKPDYTEAWFYRGLAMLELRKGEDAPDNFEVTRNGKKIVVAKLKWYSEAINSFDKAIATKPDYAEAWFYRGIALHYSGHYSEAVVSFDKVIAIKPDTAEAWFYRGGTLGKLFRYTEAISSYDKAIKN